MKTLQNLKQLIQRLRILDDKQIQEMEKRLAKSKGKEKEALEKEIFMETEKIKAEQNVMALEQNLEKGMEYFNNLIRQAIQILNNSAYPADAVTPLSQARMTLKDITVIIEKVKGAEEKITRLTKEEKGIMRKERDTA